MTLPTSYAELDQLTRSVSTSPVDASPPCSSTALRQARQPIEFLKLCARAERSGFTCAQLADRDKRMRK